MIYKSKKQKQTVVLLHVTSFKKHKSRIVHKPLWKYIKWDFIFAMIYTIYEIPNHRPILKAAGVRPTSETLVVKKDRTINVLYFSTLAHTHAPPNWHTRDVSYRLSDLHWITNPKNIKWNPNTYTYLNFFVFYFFI